MRIISLREMLWFIPVLLSFDLIEAIVPVIIILILIAAAAGLTRGTDIFALFGLGTIMGFANAGSGRVGKGLKGTRYGADAMKRGRAAGKAKGGIIKNIRKAKKNYAAAKAKAPAAKNRVRMQRAKLINRRLKNLQAKGMGNSPKAARLKGKLNKIRKANIAAFNAKKVADNLIKNPGSKAALSGLAGGMAISAASVNKLMGKKISGRASKLNNQYNLAQKNIERMQKKHLNIGVYKQAGITSFDQIKTKTRNMSVSGEGVRLGHVPKFNNYVKAINTKTGTQINLLKIPKSAFIQKGATTAVAMALLQRHWSKQVEAGGKNSDRAERHLGKLNNIIAKQHYGAKSSSEAFEAASKGELRSKNAGKLKNIISVGLPIPGGGTVGKIAGRRYGERELERFPNEKYWGEYRARRREYEKIRREMDAAKNHTLLHPIAGRHGPASIEAERKKVWSDAYNEALKGMK
ncbi:MAG: hypothetical protein QW814_01440 [Methanothrix sp.]